MFMFTCLASSFPPGFNRAGRLRIAPTTRPAPTKAAKIFPHYQNHDVLGAQSSTPRSRQPQTWPPNLLSKASALTRSSLTSSKTTRRAPAPALVANVLARAEGDGSKMSDWASRLPRMPLRAITSVRSHLRMRGWLFARASSTDKRLNRVQRSDQSCATVCTPT